MIKPLHSSDYTVSPDGTLELRGLTPGKRVHVVVEEAEQAGKRKLGFIGTRDFQYIDPEQPACDPDDWEANR